MANRDAIDAATDNATVTDDDMEDEWNRLDMAQNQLHEELATFMNMVVTLQTEDEEQNAANNNDSMNLGFSDDSFNNEEKIYRKEG